MTEVLVALALAAGAGFPVWWACERIHAVTVDAAARSARLDALFSAVVTGRSGPWAGQSASVRLTSETVEAVLDVPGEPEKLAAVRRAGRDR